MKILKRDHLTLSLDDPHLSLKFNKLIIADMEKFISSAESGVKNEDGNIEIETDSILFDPFAVNILVKITDSLPKISDLATLSCKFNFLICSSIFQASELIKIGNNFTGRTFKDIRLGTYAYLLGKKEALKFEVGSVGIQGLYFNGEVAFHFFVDTETGEYYFPPKYESLFTRFIKIIIFVELGDIEVIEIAGGRSNGATKKEGKIVNDTKNTVYIVDSSWNKLIVRTEGFAIRGHFRLQACGPGLKDRKLIWINAHVHNGYTRPPRATIIKD